MQRYNMQSFVRVTAFLVLANALLGDANSKLRNRIGSDLVKSLKNLKSICTETRYYTPSKTTDRSKGCFIYELEKIGKNCIDETFEKDDEIEDNVSKIRQLANIVFECPKSTNTSCQGYKLEPFQIYRETFLDLVMQVNSNARSVVGRGKTKIPLCM